MEIFAWIVGKARPKIKREGEAPPYGIPGIFEEDRGRILEEHRSRKFPFEKAPPGPRLHWIATNDATGRLLKGDERNVRATVAAAARPADEERRRRIADLKGQIAALKGKKK